MYSLRAVLLFITISTVYHSQYCSAAYAVDVDVNDPKIINYVKIILQSMNSEYDFIKILQGTSMDLGSDDFRYLLTLSVRAVQPNQMQICELKFIKHHSTPPRFYEVESFKCKA